MPKLTCCDSGCDMQITDEYGGVFIGDMLRGSQLKADQATLLQAANKLQATSGVVSTFLSNSNSLISLVGLYVRLRPNL